MGFLLKDGYERSTEQLAAKDSFDYWREAICDEYVQLDCDNYSGDNFNGRLRGGVGVGDLRFSEVISDPQLVQRSKYQIAKSVEEDFLISFQLSQRGLVRQNGREARLQPGSFAMYDSTQPYALSFNQPFHQLIVQMPKPILAEHLIDPEKYTAIPISSTSGLGAILSNFIFSLAQETKNISLVSQELSDNLLNMIAMAFSSSVKLEQMSDNTLVQDSLKSRIKKFIENNINNAKLSNSLIAESQGISVRYLNKLFQQEELSLHQLILDKRLHKARVLLLDQSYKNHSIEQIAYSLGYSSPAHFSRSYKKHFGVSPSEER